MPRPCPARGRGQPSSPLLPPFGGRSRQTYRSAVPRPTSHHYLSPDFRSITWLPGWWRWCVWSCGGARDNPSHLRQISATVVPTEQKKRKKTGWENSVRGWLIGKWLLLVLSQSCSGFNAHGKILKDFGEGKTWGGRKKQKHCNCRYLKLSHPSVFQQGKRGCPQYCPPHSFPLNVRSFMIGMCIIFF